MTTVEVERKARCKDCGEFVALISYDRAFNQCRPCSQKREADIEQHKNEAAVEMVCGTSKEATND